MCWKWLLFSADKFSMVCVPKGGGTTALARKNAAVSDWPNLWKIYLKSYYALVIQTILDKKTNKCMYWPFILPSARSMGTLTINSLFHFQIFSEWLKFQPINIRPRFFTDKVIRVNLFVILYFPIVRWDIRAVFSTLFFYKDQ